MGLPDFLMRTKVGAHVTSPAVCFPICGRAFGGQRFGLPAVRKQHDVQSESFPAPPAPTPCTPPAASPLPAGKEQLSGWQTAGRGSRAAESPRAASAALPQSILTWHRRWGHLALGARLCASRAAAKSTGSGLQAFAGQVSERSGAQGAEGTSGVQGAVGSRAQRCVQSHDGRQPEEGKLQKMPQRHVQHRWLQLHHR